MTRHVAAVHRRESQASRREHRRSLAATTAAEAIGPIGRGCEIFGLTLGSFSLVDILTHCLAATGPADVALSTWTAAGADMSFAYRLMTDGAIRAMRWIVDFSFPRRQPAYCNALRERFGDETIRVMAIHAKFAVITNESWNIVIRSSMNLNENRRCESFEISDDAAMARMLLEVVDALFAEHEPGEQWGRHPGQNKRCGETLARLGTAATVFGDGPLETDVRRAGWSTEKGGQI